MMAIWAAVSLLVIGAVALAGADRLRAHRSETEVSFNAQAQAPAVARAGLTDAFAWLRRQSAQPVAAFAPRRDLTASPPIDETEDPDIGLVRSYQVATGIWARYEVRKGRPMDPFTDTNYNGQYDVGEPFVDLQRTASGAYEPPPADDSDAAQGGGNGPGPGGVGGLSDGSADGRWTPSMWTRHVAAERGAHAAGSVWRLEARGLIFARPRTDLPLGTGPNKLLASATLASEVRRLTIAPPASAAVCAASEGAVTLGAHSRLRSDVLGLAVASADGELSRLPGSEVRAPAVHGVVPGDLSVVGVFGVDWPQLESMADVSTSMRMDWIPERIEDFQLVAVDGALTYDADLPLRGMGVLAVRGDLLIDSGSNSDFTGLVFVDGDVTVRGPAQLRGTIIASGRVTLAGAAGAVAEVRHDPTLVARLLARMGQYRLTRAIYRPDVQLVDRVLADGGNPHGTGGTPWAPSAADDPIDLDGTGVFETWVPDPGE